MRKALYLMGILDDQDTEWLSEYGTSQFVSAGTILIREGRPLDHLYVVLDGQFSVVSGSVQVATLYSGEVMGEISLVDSRPPNATVTAIQDCRVLAISHEHLEQKMGRDQKFAANFYRAIATFLADRLRVTTGRLGYGDSVQDLQPPDELSDEMMDTLALAAARFDKMLKRLSAGAR